MQRELGYLAEANDEKLLSLRHKGWSFERLEILFVLNSFYQIVLGPLASSARERTGTLGEEIPIIYGDALRFDADRARQLKAAHKAFFDALADVPNALKLLTANRADDLLYRLQQAEEDHG